MHVVIGADSGSVAGRGAWPLIAGDIIEQARAATPLPVIEVPPTMEFSPADQLKSIGATYTSRMHVTV